LRIEGGTLIGKALPIPQIAIDQRIAIDNHPLQALFLWRWEITPVAAELRHELTFHCQPHD